MKTKTIEPARIQAMVAALREPTSRIMVKGDDAPKRGWFIEMPHEHNPRGMSLSTVSPLLHDALRIHFAPFYKVLRSYTNDFKGLLEMIDTNPESVTLENLGLNANQAEDLVYILMIVTTKLPDHVIEQFEGDEWHGFREVHKDAVSAQLAIEGYVESTEPSPRLIKALELFMGLAVDKIELDEANTRPENDADIPNFEDLEFKH